MSLKVDLLSKDELLFEIKLRGVDPRPGSVVVELRKRLRQLIKLEVVPNVVHLKGKINYRDEIESVKEQLDVLSERLEESLELKNTLDILRCESKLKHWQRRLDILNRVFKPEVIQSALVLIFNTQLYVRQCSMQFKMYTTPARLWAGGQHAVLVVTGQHVAVVPFYLGKQRLAALVGSQAPDSAPPATLAVWQTTAVKEEVEELKPDTQPQMFRLIQTHIEEGLSQRMIAQMLFPIAIDSNDPEGLTTLLKNINDIPESCIIAVLSFCLKDIETPGHKELLRLVLSLPMTADLSTLGLLRHKLKLGTVLNLLRQLSEAMLLTPGDPQLVEWATLLLDAYYQQYLLSRDPAVIEVLSELKAIVDKQVVVFDNVV
ncbi:Nucleolar protein 11 [Homalodisca vitripennis]|nr:Nucleolar protein 11 [Homalodisca vitripennis]